MGPLCRLIGWPKPIADGPAVFPVGISRSGTTLLTTVLDSHSQISMGYELFPPKLPSPEELEALVDEGLSLAHGDFRRAGGALRRAGKREVGLFVARCHRAGIPVEELREILRDLRRDGGEPIATLRRRFALAWRIVDTKRLREGTRFCGFKLSPGVVKRASRYLPGGYFLFLLRDPRDIVASQMQRGFDRPVERVCSTWNACWRAFKSLDDGCGRSLILRYEDLVSKPREAVERISALLSIPVEDEVLAFHRSKASVHTSNHPNAANLAKGFFTSSVGRWKRELSLSLATSIARKCRKGMREYGYAQRL